FSPGPVYSRTLFRAHFTSKRRSNSKITSFALTHGLNFPVTRTLTTDGIVMRYGSPAIAFATSKPPAPIASMPQAPACGVWESQPTIVHPEGDLLTRVHFPGDEVVPNQFASERFPHGSPFGVRENLVAYQSSVRTDPTRGNGMQP